MGHDIYAYNFDPDEKEIAYLRKGAFNTMKHQIYEVLESNFANAGCSGDGSYWYFEKDILIEALEKAEEKHIDPDVKDFLKKCIKKCKGFGILINFA